MQKLLLCLLLSSCAGAPINMNIAPKAMVEMNSIYNPVVEKSWCLTSSGIQNVLTGGPFSSPMPICNRADIVMHSHPIYAESEANFLDWGVWGEYKNRYGNDLYGVMAGENSFKFYER